MLKGPLLSFSLSLSPPPFTPHLSLPLSALPPSLPPSLSLSLSLSPPPSPFLSLSLPGSLPPRLVLAQVNANALVEVPENIMFMHMLEKFYVSDNEIATFPEALCKVRGRFLKSDFAQLFH